MENLNSNSNNKFLFLNQKEYLNKKFLTPQHLEEYFLIIGIDPIICFNKEIFCRCLSLNELNDYFIKNDVKPTIMTKFPPVTKSYINIDCSLINLCFPNNFKIEEYNSEPDHIIQYLILDNSFYSIEYSQIYITCFKFYEKFSDYYKFYSYITKNNCKIDINEKFNNYYIEKVICLVSTQKHFKQQENILKQIYQYYKENKIKTIPMEKIILNILFNIPIPPKGVLEIRYNTMPNYDVIKIKQQKMNKLPYISKELNYIFSNFKLDNFLEIFKYILYETKTVIFSTNINNITFFICGLTSLLYPLKYSFQISSSITDNIYSVLESISPFILGINKKYTKTFFKENKIDISDQNILIINLDDHSIIYQGFENVPKIPEKYYNKLTKIESILKTNNNENDFISIQKIFLKFFVKIFLDYDKYMNNDYLKTKEKYTGLKNIFKIKEYLESRETDEKSFFEKITETQMFNDFIYKKMIPKDTNDKMNTIFFDENIAKKKNSKKLFNSKKNFMFLDSTDYEYKQCYKIPATQNLTNEEKKIFEKNNFNEIFNNFLKYGQIISINKNEINFEYLIFPKLNEIFYYNASSKEFFKKPENLYISDVDGINTDILSEYNLNKNSKRRLSDKRSMKNCIYLTYVELWAFTYEYHDPCEREYRFDKLLEVLDLISNHESENFNICFETLYKFKEKDKILKLYDMILKYNITINSYIFEIKNNIQSKIETKKSLMNDNNLLPNNTDELSKDEINFENFRKRSFKFFINKNCINKKIIIYTKQICPLCSQLIDLYKISLSYKNIIKDQSWVKCPSCYEYILPKLSVKIGDDIIFKKTKNTKIIDDQSFILYSPYELKMRIKHIMTKNEIKSFSVEKFKEKKYQDIFWSCIWFFKIYNINYDFILPYEQNIDKENTLNSETLANNIDSEINNKTLKEKLPHKIKKNKNKKIKISYKNNKNIIRNSVISFSILYNNESNNQKETYNNTITPFDEFEDDSIKRYNTNTGGLKRNKFREKLHKILFGKCSDNNKNDNTGNLRWTIKESTYFENNDKKTQPNTMINPSTKLHIVRSSQTNGKHLKSNDLFNAKNDENLLKNKIEHSDNYYSRKESLSSSIYLEDCKNELLYSSLFNNSEIKINRNLKAKSFHCKKKRLGKEFSFQLYGQRTNSAVFGRKSCSPLVF